MTLTLLYTKAGEMAQQVKVLAAQSDHPLNSGRTEWTPELSFDLCTHTVLYKLTLMLTYIVYTVSSSADLTVCA